MNSTYCKTFKCIKNRSQVSRRFFGHTVISDSVCFGLWRSNQMLISVVVTHPPLPINQQPPLYTPQHARTSTDLLHEGSYSVQTTCNPLTSYIVLLHFALLSALFNFEFQPINRCLLWYVNNQRKTLRSQEVSQNLFDTVKILVWFLYFQILCL